jgi:hypothetical protein
MRRITWSVLLLLFLVGLGAGCSNQAGPKSEKIAPLPASGPKGLTQTIDFLPPTSVR